MQDGKKNPLVASIPNAITMLNLLSGSLSLLFALRYGDLVTASMFIVLAAVFDFFDGLVARALGVSSPIGKDLDSLADVVSFGVAPSALIWVALVNHVCADVSWSLPAFLIGMFAGLRLAKFNNDTRQTTSFIGLPVPANALFWIGYQYVLVSYPTALSIELSLALTLVLVCLFSYLMVSEVPMFSFKLGGGKGIKGMTNQLILLIGAVIMLLLWRWMAFAPIILLYILLSVIGTTKAKA